MKLIHIICTIALFTVSCSEKFDLTDHFDPTKSFEVIDQDKPILEEYKIQVNDLRHAKLLSWLELNNKNWKPTHNEWAGLVIVYQENFRLLLYRNSEFAVVIITDDENISRYYRRTFDNDGLKFLDE